MEKSPYIAHTPNADGYISYSQEEHTIWRELLTRQALSIQGRACQAYLDGLQKLDLPQHIPQLADIDKVLQANTGFKTAPVPALISFGRFFELLANKSFPVATFIRSREDFDYIQEPDIFHEIVGHCPLLTHPAFAHFTQTYGKLGLKANKTVRVYLARLYWFTMEFGLINTTEGLRIYGGGILSSPAETEYALSGKPEYRPFHLNDILRTPYRIDKIQPIYYVIDSPDVLFGLDETTLMREIEQAMADGLHPAHPSLLQSA